MLIGHNAGAAHIAPPILISIFSVLIVRPGNALMLTMACVVCLPAEFDEFEADKQSAEEKNADQRRRMRARYETKIQLMKEEIGRLQEAEQ